MARLIETSVKRPLSELLLFGDLPDAVTILVERVGDELVVKPKP